MILVGLGRCFVKSVKAKKKTHTHIRKRIFVDFSYVKIFYIFLSFSFYFFLSMCDGVNGGVTKNVLRVLKELVMKGNDDEQYYFYVYA